MYNQNGLISGNTEVSALNHERVPLCCGTLLAYREEDRYEMSEV